ncbi:MAG: hypothetical protein GY761_19750 [Hyphomicrobiales bacterium]|nr:hypothetical protein [Hyphomicrobiales bacterium]
MTAKSIVLKAIRKKCLDCCVGQSAEVRKCHLQDCDLWPFRFGADPNPSKTRGFKKGASTGVILSKKEPS